MNPVIKNFLGLLGCLCLAALFSALHGFAGFMRSADQAAQQIAPTLDQRLASIERTVDSRLASIETKADGRAGELVSLSHKFEADANSRLDDAIRLTDDQVTSTRRELLAEVHPLASQASDALAAYAALPRSVQPTIDTMNELSGPLLRNSLGTIAAVKVTAGESAQTMKTVRDALPAFVAAVQKSADGSAETAQHAGEFTASMVKTFRPLPRAVQVPLAIIGGAGSAAYPWASLLIQRAAATVNVTTSKTQEQIEKNVSHH